MLRAKKRSKNSLYCKFRRLYEKKNRVFLFFFIFCSTFLNATTPCPLHNFSHEGSINIQIFQLKRQIEWKRENTIIAKFFKSDHFLDSDYRLVYYRLSGWCAAILSVRFSAALFRLYLTKVATSAIYVQSVTKIHIYLFLKYVFFAYISGTTWAKIKLSTSICILV